MEAKPKINGRGRKSKLSKDTNKMKFFYKHIVEGKPLKTCTEELGIKERQLQYYKKDEDFRQMAIRHFEDSKLKGLKGTVGKLVGALDATKPLVTQDADGSTHITHVPDAKTRMTALQEVIKIYGLYAPQRKDTEVRITLSPDEDLFRQIDAAQRACRVVESQEVGQGSLPMADGQPGTCVGITQSRQRALLQVDALSEPK